MARSISFLTEGPVQTRVTITETADGSLLFEVESLDGPLVGDLGSIFFDLSGPDLSDPLDLDSLCVGPTATDDDVTDTKFGDASATNRGQGQNVIGEVANEPGAFDVGIRFGPPGIGKDDIRATSFVLSSSDGPLSLDMLSLTDFAVRHTSVGDEDGSRDDSLKLGGQTSAVTQDDTLAVEEYLAGATNLLANDADGARRTVVAVSDDDGTFDVVPGGFSRLVVVDGRALGTLIVGEDGAMAFTADGADIDALALGESAEHELTYTSAAGGTTATAGVKLTVVGANDAPVIVVAPGDRDTESLTETSRVLDWTFDSRPETFDFLAKGGSQTMTCDILSTTRHRQRDRHRHRHDQRHQRPSVRRRGSGEGANSGETITGSFAGSE